MTFNKYLFKKYVFYRHLPLTTNTGIAITDFTTQRKADY